MNTNTKDRYNDAIHILVVEDEGIVAMELEDTLTTGGYKIAGVADNGRGALAIMEEGTVDLALLDIQIKGEWDGVETARRLMACREIPFIFLTAFSDEQTVQRARNATPSAYLVKPYQRRSLFIAIDLALHNFAQRKARPGQPLAVRPSAWPPAAGAHDELLVFNDSLFIKQHQTFVKVPLIDVQYLEAAGNHTMLFCSGRKYVVRHVLTDLVDRLASASFIRVHRSYAINMQRLSTFSNTAVCIDQQEIPLGRRYKEAFFKQFKAG